MTDDAIKIAPEDVAVIDLNTKSGFAEYFTDKYTKKSIGLL